VHGANHFECLVIKNGEWFHSDGYALAQFRPLGTSELSALEKRAVLSIALYFMYRNGGG
jgi:hypothetical protein